VCNRGRILVLTVLSIFLLAGVTFAGVVTLEQPNGGEMLTAGKVYTISIDNIDYASLPTNVGVVKYKLFYSCKGNDYKDEFGKRIWQVITTRSCGLYKCPTDYPWEVPNVQKNLAIPNRQCKVKVQLLNASGKVLVSDISDNWFTIKKYLGITPPPS
jgi:hypothetical protein